MAVTEITGLGQIIIPLSILNDAGLKKGDKVVIYAEGGRICVEGTAVEKMRSFRRTGQAKGLIKLPEDFDEHFSDMDAEIAEMFYGGEV